MPSLTPCMVPLRQKVPVVNGLSRFKTLVSDLARPLIHNQSLFPMKTGNSTAVTSLGFFKD